MIHKLTLVCRRVGCGALVNWRHAKAKANRMGRGTLAKGDGCAGHRCAARFKRARFAAQQRKMAAALRAGRRVLAAWPQHADDTEVWLLPAEMRDAAALVAEGRVA